MPAPMTCKSAPGDPERFGHRPSASIRINNFSRNRNLSGVVRHLGHRAAGWSRALGCRGATSAMLAASITVLLGCAGLAVEAGNWYLSLRNAATAADLAALAGAAALDRGADYRAVALNTAALNGFPNANEVTVGPPTSGKFTSDSTAVQVVISRAQSISLSRLFVSSAPTIQSRAVAAAHTDEQVCVLALNGGLTLGGNSTTNAGGCVLGSNARSPNGITIAGSARVRADGLITRGNCTGCTSGDVWTDDTRKVRPTIVAGRPDPITDPFANLQNWTPSPPSGCLALNSKWPQSSETSKGNATISPGTSICGDLTVGPQQTLTLQPGIYYFNNANLNVQGTINGNGVTLVFTGDTSRVGTIQINAQASGSLSGPTGSLITGHPEAAGLLLYRDVRATNNDSNSQVQLNGGANMVLFGGTYFPSSNVVVNGNSAMGSTCLAIVGYSLSFSGTADTTVNVSGCKNFTPYPVLRTVRLVE